MLCGPDLLPELVQVIRASQASRPVNLMTEVTVILPVCYSMLEEDIGNGTYAALVRSHAYCCQRGKGSDASSGEEQQRSQNPSSKAHV